jgi:ribosomal protein S18 acetylase RimI-like enzyme
MAHIATRPATPVDIPFLVELRLRTIDEHIRRAGTHLTHEEHVARAASNLTCCMVVLDHGRPIGMTKVLRAPDRWCLDQIQIEPEKQRRGIGTQLVRGLQREAGLAGVRLTLEVLKANPALHLYERLGFRIVSENDATYAMESST